MTLPLFVLIAVAGGIGATLRLMLDGVIRARVKETLPWGTITINLTGSLLLGLLTGLAAAQLVPEAWHLVIGTGFLGGYTTFSTASFETIRLIQERKWFAGLVNGLGTLLSATALAGLGLWVGTML
ncbi:fluoride efflux transporter CrcB [Kocuria coralli]|uniref:Fluoride-specific ion channel FluC n=1 Tax=Kocuria coralli TaxID=1461025 RepID=A0A5J5L385_9MICC|nr:fluoride efflux transporter CrcB [Kocuria coralli]KAA9395471.1 fluoride efflux transporter CrcB [Kocuria coralli]